MLASLFVSICPAYSYSNSQGKALSHQEDSCLIHFFALGGSRSMRSPAFTFLGYKSETHDGYRSIIGFETTRSATRIATG